MVDAVGAAHDRAGDGVVEQRALDELTVAGGESAHTQSVADVFAFDPAANTWTTLSSLPSPRFSGVAAAIDDKIYFTGGSSTTTTWLGTPVPVL